MFLALLHEGHHLIIILFFELLLYQFMKAIYNYSLHCLYPFSFYLYPIYLTLNCQPISFHISLNIITFVLFSIHIICFFIANFYIINIFHLRFISCLLRIYFMLLIFHFMYFFILIHFLVNYKFVILVLIDLPY